MYTSKFNQDMENRSGNNRAVFEEHVARVVQTCCISPVCATPHFNASGNKSRKD